MHETVIPSEEWDNDLEHHIRQCPCTCNHLGYGNYWDYKANAEVSKLPDINRRKPDVAPLSPQWPLNHSQVDHHSLYQIHENGQLHNGEHAVSSLADNISTTSREEVTTRQWILLVVVLLFATATGVGVAIPLALKSGASIEERLSVAKRILSSSPLIDGHNDLPWNIRKLGRGRLSEVQLDNAEYIKSQPSWARSDWTHTDLVRLKEGHVGAQFWAAYVPCEAQDLSAVKLTLEQIDLIKRMITKYPDYLTLVNSSKGIEEAVQAGKIASIIGVEGGHLLGNSLGVLRMYYDLGVRMLTLTHTCSNPWADASMRESGKEPVMYPSKKAGLSTFGKVVIKEMNRLGVIVDLSHVSAHTMHDALSVSHAPVIFSHSSARSLCNTSRNVPDEVLRKLPGNGGIVMISFYSSFLTCNKTSSLSDVIAHINYIRHLIGVDHVGIGAGFDGINFTPRGLEDASKYPYLFAELLKDPTWTEEDLRKLAGKNFLRVFKEVERIRDEWNRADVLPEETVIPPEDTRGHDQCTYKIM